MMSELNESFVEARRQDLLQKLDEIRQTLKMNTEEFNELLSDVSTKDFPAIAEETRDKSTHGQVQLADWDQLRRVSSALHRIDEGAYGQCLSCSGPISRERLEAMPEAPLCIACESRREAGREEP